MIKCSNLQTRSRISDPFPSVSCEEVGQNASGFDIASLSLLRLPPLQFSRHNSAGSSSRKESSQTCKNETAERILDHSGLLGQPVVVEHIPGTCGVQKRGEKNN